MPRRPRIATARIPRARTGPARIDTARINTARIDPIAYAIPGFVASMVLERVWLARHPGARPRAADYDVQDTLASVSMGVGTLLLPPLTARLLAHVTPGTGRHARVFAGAAAGAAVVATLLDALDRHRSGRYAAGELPEARTLRAEPAGEPGDKARDTIYMPKSAEDIPKSADLVERVGGGLAGPPSPPPPSRAPQRWPTAPRPSGSSSAPAPTSARAPSRRAWRSSAGTSSTTGTIGRCTSRAGCERCTSCTTAASTTTSRRRCGSRSQMV